MAIFVLLSLIELISAIASEARMLYPDLLLGKGKVLQITPSLPKPVLTSSKDYEEKLLALFL